MSTLTNYITVAIDNTTVGAFEDSRYEPEHFHGDDGTFTGISRQF
jgi:hypothetical protein